MKRFATLLCCLLAFAAPATAAAAEKKAKATRDELTIGITQFPATFNPAIEPMLAKSYILAMTRRPFTVYDKDWKIVCLLCTELPSIENGGARIEDLPDGKQGMAIDLAIHPDAKWGDGVPVTTKDVMLAWEIGQHPRSGVVNRDFYQRIRSIDVHDDKRFTAHLDKVYFDYPQRASLDPLPAHLERAAFSEPAEYKNRTRYDRDTANPGLYYGPYRIAEMVLGSHVVLETNPHWYGKKPHFKRIVVRKIENTAALEANLRSGAIDYIAGELGLSLDQALAFEKRNAKRYNFKYRPGLIYEHLDLNLDNPILADRRVRRALILGIDRAIINKQLFRGRQPVANTFVNPLDWIAKPDVASYRFDRKRAAKLLDAAGWAKKKRGVRHNAAGQPLTLTLMTTAGNRSRETVQQVLQSQWKKLGVDVRIRNEPPRVFFGQTVRERRFTGLAMFAWISSPESVPRTTLRSDQIPTLENNFSGQNTTGFKNDEVDQLVDGIEVELDRDKRQALWHRLQEIYASELPVIPLYFRANPFILPKWLKGVEPTGHQFTTTLWVEHWRAEPAP